MEAQVEDKEKKPIKYALVVEKLEAKFWNELSRAKISRELKNLKRKADCFNF